MSAHTVDWSTFRSRPASAQDAAEGLRERKKRQMRQLLSDTATKLFLDRGFDAVRVAEIAQACGVSEKTVFNYFPTKEALVLDRWETTPRALREALADPRAAPVDAVLAVLADELAALTTWVGAQPDFGETITQVKRFGALIHSTPPLRAYQHDATGRLINETAQALADRTHTPPDDVEPLAAAHALIGLWAAQAASLRHHLDAAGTADELYEAVTADTRRAARVVEDGLHGWTRVSGNVHQGD